jgi:tetratricopeptide (TPR) repeat protein
MQYKHDFARNILGVTIAAVLLSLVPLAVSAQQGNGIQADAAVRDMPPAAWLQQDPGDSIYKAGRDALNRGQYREAVEHFRQLRRQYPQSGYSADAYYWEAFALDRLGSVEDAVKGYRNVLEQHPGDAESLQALENIFRTTSDWNALISVYDQRVALTEDPSRKRDCANWSPLRA